MRCAGGIALLEREPGRIQLCDRASTIVYIPLEILRLTDAPCVQANAISRQSRMYDGGCCRPDRISGDAFVEQKSENTCDGCGRIHWRRADFSFAPAGVPGFAWG